MEQIRENPYLQYFIGLPEYRHQAPFDASMMVHFRKRISRDLIGRINAAVVKRTGSQEPKELEPGSETVGESPREPEGEAELPPNQGQLLVDASCAPADIRYPTDLSLLNEAREQAEAILDALYESVKGQLEKKPRTYREQAGREYLKVVKQRKASQKVIRKAIGKQLGYLRRNLEHIDQLIAAGA